MVDVTDTASLRAAADVVDAVVGGLDVLVTQMDARPTGDSVPDILWAITFPNDGPLGGFFPDGQPLPW